MYNGTLYSVTFSYSNFSITVRALPRAFLGEKYQKGMVRVSWVSEQKYRVNSYHSVSGEKSCQKLKLTVPRVCEEISSPFSKIHLRKHPFLTIFLHKNMRVRRFASISNCLLWVFSSRNLVLTTYSPRMSI